MRHHRQPLHSPFHLRGQATHNPSPSQGVPARRRVESFPPFSAPRPSSATCALLLTLARLARFQGLKQRIHTLGVEVQGLEFKEGVRFKLFRVWDCGLPCGSYLRARHVLARLRRRSVDWKVSERSAPLASHVKVNKQSQLIQQTRRCVSAGFVTCRRRHCPLLGQRPAHQPSEELLPTVKVRV